jgi:hypothetical protein
MTLWLLMTFPAPLLAVLMLGMFVLLAVAGLVVVRRYIQLKDREGLHEVAGFIYATIGVAYAVLMALVVLVVWEQLSPAPIPVRLPRNCGHNWRCTRAASSSTNGPPWHSASPVPSPMRRSGQLRTRS